MDAFSALFAHIAPSARTFFSGKLCATVEFDGGGHLHLLRRGTLRVVRPSAADMLLEEPSLLFFARGHRHRLVVDPIRGADIACAYVDLGGEAASPIAAALPEVVALRLREHEPLAPACELLFGEAFGDGEGRRAALDRLFDYLLIVLIRHVVAIGAVEGGVLAGLAEPRLARALTAMHAAPGKPWSLDRLADEAGMSRTSFAEAFRAVIGRTPIDYLTRWRMVASLGPLLRGRPIKAVAASVGYDSAPAFTRVFTRVLGASPRAWLARSPEVDPYAASIRSEPL